MNELNFLRSSLLPKAMSQRPFETHSLNIRVEGPLPYVVKTTTMMVFVTSVLFSLISLFFNFLSLEQMKVNS